MIVEEFYNGENKLLSKRTFEYDDYFRQVKVIKHYIVDPSEKAYNQTEYNKFKQYSGKFI